MFALTAEPKHYPECCLSLSNDLFTRLTEFVQEAMEASQREVVLLSVGCGTGFLEAALAAHLQEQALSQTRVEGIEVPSADTRFLPSELVHRVHGTRDICRRAECADILMFVYPREGELVKQYCTEFVDNVRMVLWLGPRADWLAQQGMLHDMNGYDGPVFLENAGLAPYEIAAAYRNITFSRIKQHNSTQIKQHASTRVKQRGLIVTNAEPLVINFDSI